MKTVTFGLVVIGSAIAASLSGCSSGDRGDTVAKSESAVSDRCSGKVNGKLKQFRNGENFKNANGFHSTISTNGGDYLDTSNPFFDDSIGTNGRSCDTCHAPEDGMSISAASVNARYDASCGQDPLFTGDGAVAPNMPTATDAQRRAAFALLLSKGLIRIKLKIPANAQFTLVSVDRDPYGNSTDGNTAITVFRRPLAATNLAFLNAIMWDNREGAADPAVLDQNLRNQAANAAIGHAGAPGRPDEAVLQQMVDFEKALYTTQVINFDTGNTSGEGALGAPSDLAATPFAINENRVIPVPPPPASPLNVLTRTVFTTFDSWQNSTDAAHAAVARGQDIFNNREITDVGQTGLLRVTCSTCHNSFNAGSMSASTTTRPFAAVPTVFISDPAVVQDPDLPLYTFHETIPPFRTLQTTDPGEAMTTGLTRDWNKFKSSTLRGLSSRAPYFHNGHAATLADVVDHYDNVFNTRGVTPRFTAQERSDLIAFLSTL